MWPKWSSSGEHDELDRRRRRPARPRRSDSLTDGGTMSSRPPWVSSTGTPSGTRSAGRGERVARRRSSSGPAAEQVADDAARTAAAPTPAAGRRRRPARPPRSPARAAPRPARPRAAAAAPPPTPPGARRRSARSRPRARGPAARPCGSRPGGRSPPATSSNVVGQPPPRDAPEPPVLDVPRAQPRAARSRHSGRISLRAVAGAPEAAVDHDGDGRAAPSPSGHVQLAELRAAAPVVVALDARAGSGGDPERAHRVGQPGDALVDLLRRHARVGQPQRVRARPRAGSRCP